MRKLSQIICCLITLFVIFSGVVYACITNNKPIAVLSPESHYLFATSGLISFDGTSSYDPDSGDTITYYWDLDGNGIYELIESTGKASSSYCTPGTTTTVKFKVKDNHGLFSSVQSRKITVPVVPQATAVDPLHYESDVALNDDLIWSSGQNVASHDVYFGLKNGSLDFQGNQLANTFDPGTLSLHTEYQWRIDQKYQKGPVWLSDSQGDVIQFDGSGNNYVRFPNTTLDQVGSMTMAFWFKFIGGHPYIFSAYGTSDVEFSISGFFSNLQTTLSVYNQGTWQSWQLGSAYLYQDLWHHITIVRNDTNDTLALYVNGLLVGEVSQTMTALTVPAGTDSVVFGKNHFSDGSAVHGSMLLSFDEMKIYDGAMDAASVGQLYRGQTPAMGTLRAHWNFNETSGDVVNDSSGGTLYNGTIHDTSRGSWVTDGGHTGLSHDGVNDIATIGDIAGLEGLSDITLTAWVKPSARTSEETVINKSWVYSMAIDTASKVRFYTGTELGPGSWSSATLVSNSTITEGAWTHIAMTYDGVAKKIFINGTLDATKQDVTTTGLLISYDNNLLLGGLTGMIDDLRIYNTAIDNETDIQAIRDNTYTTTNPIGHWTLDEGSGIVVGDSSSNNYDGVLGGLLWYSNVGKGGKVDGALQFDGNNDYVETPFVIDPSANNSLSAFAWIKTADTHGTIMQQLDGSGTTGRTYLYINNSYLNTNLKNSGGASLADDTINLSDNKWHHVGVVWNRDTDTRQLYIDGAVVKSDVLPGDPELEFSDGGMHFGANKQQPPTGWFYTGLMDEMYIYNIALDQNNVTYLMTNGDQGNMPGSSPLAHWTLDAHSRDSIASHHGYLQVADCDTTQGSVWEFDTHNVLYVDDSAPLGGAYATKGFSWADPYTHLQDALQKARDLGTISEIRIGQGTYKANQAEFVTVQGNFADSFDMVSGVTLKGGYAGYGAAVPALRDVTLYPSIFNGDLDGNDSGFSGYTENTDRIVDWAEGTGDAHLDGITVQGAEQDGLYLHFGSTPGSPTIQNCLITKNKDSGIYVNSNANPTIVNCDIVNNANDPSQAGIYVAQSNSAADIYDCIVSDQKYAGVYCGNGHTDMQRCIIRKNGTGILTGSSNGPKFEVLNTVISYNNGHGIFHDATNSLSTITNCTIYGNNSQGIRGDSTTHRLTVNSCIIYNNSSTDATYCNISHSTIEDSLVGSNTFVIGVIHSYPLLVDADGADNIAGNADDDFTLWHASPCVDTGDPALPHSLEPDAGGNLEIDMGAYGNTPQAPDPTDSDTNQLADAWELHFWPSDPIGSRLATADEENGGTGDGLPNIDEYFIGWDPTVDDSTNIKGIVNIQGDPVNYPSINIAIQHADQGDTLTLEATTFNETIVFSTKPVTIQSINVNDPAATIVSAVSTSDNVFTLGNSALSSVVLDGITITGGDYGIYCNNASPTIRNCIIRDNQDSGVYALNSSDPVIDNCTIQNNSISNDLGAGVVAFSTNSDVVISNCVFTSNRNYGIRCDSGNATVTSTTIANHNFSGIFCDDDPSWVSLTNTLIYTNTGGSNGVTLEGRMPSNSVGSSFINCTIYGHTTAGIRTTYSNVPVEKILNCILWSNNNEISSSAITSSTISYSCIEDTGDTGEGVIHAYPIFNNVASEDFTLWYKSPCVDTGKPGMPFGNEPGGGGLGIDMGAYGNTAQAPDNTDNDGNQLADAWELTYWPNDPIGTHLPTGDDDVGGGDGLTNFDEFYIGWDPTADNSAQIKGFVDNDRLGVRFPGINSSVFHAEIGDILELQPGTFSETIHFIGKSITLVSTNVNNPAATVISAAQVTDDVITFDSSNSSNAKINGVTITGGKYGIYCRFASPDIENSIIEGNTSSGIFLAQSGSPNITNCVIQNNSSADSGGAGIRSDHTSAAPVVTNSVISNNNNYGVRIDGSADISHTTIKDHGSAGVYGEHDNSWVTLKNNIIVNNDANGVYLRGENTLSSIINCTIYGHSNRGIWCSWPGTGIEPVNIDKVVNSIVWNNNNDLHNVKANELSHNCIQDPKDTGTGIIHADPMFTDAASYDFTLKYSSLCIDAGHPDNMLYPYDQEPDAGENTAINIGAYGNTPQAKDNTDLDDDNLADGWELLYWNPITLYDGTHDLENGGAGDTLTNFDEYHIGWNPLVDDTTQIKGLVTNQRITAKYPNISLALLLAENGDTLVMEATTFVETVDFYKPVILQGANVNDPSLTIISPQSPTDNVITFDTDELTGLVLDGVTVTGGEYGIHCRYSSPIIRNCIIRDNNNSGAYIHTRSLPDFNNCVIKDNASGFSVAAGITVDHSESIVDVVDCKISSNHNYGLYCDSGTTNVTNSTIRNHLSRGAWVEGASLLISNSLIYNNAIGLDFIGTAFSEVVNCTIYGHSLKGIDLQLNNSVDKIVNSIIWNNTVDIEGDYSNRLTYSNVEDVTVSGVGVFHIDPRFVDPDGANNTLGDDDDDFHLQADSLSVDAGAPWLAFSNEPSGGVGRVNLGAYGNTSTATVSVDDDNDGLFDHWEIHYFGSKDTYDETHDPEVNSPQNGDGFTNIVEFYLNYNPNAITTDIFRVLYTNVSQVLINPTLAETMTLEYWTNKPANMDLTFTNSTTSEVARTFSEVSVPGGKKIVVWDGKDDSALILEKAYSYNMDLALNASGEVLNLDFGLIDIDYCYQIDGLGVYPRRMIATYNEASSITYSLPCDSYVNIDIYDPSLAIFRNLVVNTLQTAGAQSVVWDGRNLPPTNPASAYIYDEGLYKVRVYIEGMREQSEAFIKVYR